MNLEESFEHTFRTIFGECNLELEELEKFLLKYNYQTIKKKSALSGKPVSLSTGAFEKSALYLSQDEINLSKPYTLDINKIKDMDSIMEELGDRFYYTGNKKFGKSEHIEDSDGCFDSFYVKDSFNIQESKYIAYSSFLRGGCEYCFGSTYALKTVSSIRALLASHSSRCFDSYHVTDSSDMFFTFNCHGCTNVMFSFSQRSKSNVIGNLPLPKDKYLALKNKLIGESREYIEKHKDFYSILDYPCPLKNPPKISAHAPSPNTSMAPIEDAFAATCKILFGKSMGKIDEFQNYLNEGHAEIKEAKTAFGTPAYPTTTFFYPKLPKCRIVSNPEANEASKISVQIEDSDNLAAIIKKIEKIAFYVCEWAEGENDNIIETPIYFNSSNVYRSYSSYSKNVAYTIMAQNCESVYGSFRLLHCKFCIRCHYSHYIVRCFEVSDSSSCSDCLFCHNIENCQECMFCFNTKSKRYAIGNVELGKEKYMEIKKRILPEISNKLQTGKIPGISIFNIGCKK